MQRPHIITISGKPGSGKSSTADRVAELLNYDRYSSGDLVRKHVRKQGTTLALFNQKAESDPSMDHAIDEELRGLRSSQDMVIDSRLGFYWIPESFKVYLDLDISVAIARIFKDAVDNKGRSSEGGLASNVSDVQKQVQSRLNTEIRRFRNLYGINPYDDKHYDLIINTSRHSPETVALTVYDTYRKWLASETWKPVYNAVPMGYSFDSKY